MAPRARALSLTALNRTLLARQLLLERRAMPLVGALEAVGGLQAQDPVAPLFGLLSRLDGFAADILARAVHERRVVRGTLMRGTVHLVSARDYLTLEPAIGPLVRTSVAAHTPSMLANANATPEIAAAGTRFTSGEPTVKMSRAPERT